MTHDAHIAIVGAGIGGLTAALCFRHLGYLVDVFEQSPELKEVGAGIQISPNALRVFEKLGLDQRLKEHGLQAQAIQLMNHAPAIRVLLTFDPAPAFQIRAGHSGLSECPLQLLLIQGIVQIHQHGSPNDESTTPPLGHQYQPPQLRYEHHVSCTKKKALRLTGPFWISRHGALFRDVRGVLAPQAS